MNDTNSRDDGSLTWLLHDLIDQRKISAGDAVKISQRSEKQQVISDIAEFLYRSYDLSAKSASPEAATRGINNMRQALLVLNEQLPTIRHASILVCRYRHYCGTLRPGWDISPEALRHYRMMENAIMRIPTPVIAGNARSNKHSQQMTQLLLALSGFNSVPITEFITKMHGIDPDAIDKLISGLSAIALLMTGELNQHGAELTQQLGNLQFIANE